jgi:peptidylprolyl isomerase
MKTSTGLKYVIIKKNGKKPSRGTTINIDYTGYLEDGQLFDTSLESKAKIFGKLDPHRAAQKGYQPIVFQAGRKDGMIPGFIEGLEKLAIGDKSAVVYTFSFSLWRRRWEMLFHQILILF